LPTRIEDLENEFLNYFRVFRFFRWRRIKSLNNLKILRFLKKKKLMLPCDVHFRLQKSRTFLGTSPSFLWSCISRPKFSRSCYFSRSVKSRIIYFPIFPKIFPKFSSFIYSRHISRFFCKYFISDYFFIILLSFYHQRTLHIWLSQKDNSKENSRSNKEIWIILGEIPESGFAQLFKAISLTIAKCSIPRHRFWGISTISKSTFPHHLVHF